MTSWFVYWIILIGKLSVLFNILMVMSIVICIALLMWGYGTISDTARYGSDNEDYLFGKNLIKRTIGLIWVPIIFVILAIMTPNLKEIAAIYLIPKIANNENVQEIPGKTMDLFNANLDEWISDVKEKK